MVSRRAAVPVGLSEERSAGKASAGAKAKYTLLEAVVGPGQGKTQRLVTGDEIE